MKFICFLPIALVFLSSCGHSGQVSYKPGTGPIIKRAQIFTYMDLPSRIQEKTHDAHTYANLGETSEQIRKEQGLYVRAILDNKLLAMASTSGTNWQVLLDDSNYRALYGQHRNFPVFYDTTGAVIRQTLKDDGYDLVYIGRWGYIDTVYWGPLPAYPVRMTLVCSNLDSTHQPSARLQYIHPEFQ